MLTRRIVVGVEMPESRPWTVTGLSEPTTAALQQAFEYAVATGAALELITVLPEAGLFEFAAADALKEQLQREESEAAALLAQIQQQYEADFGPSSPVTCSVLTGKPWLGLLKAAGNDRHTLLMCGTRDVDVFRRWLFGTTGLKLLRYAPCPVWLVRPPTDPEPGLDVLAATDLSEMGQQVIEAGVTIGQHLPARLTVFHAVDEDLDRHMARTGVPEEDLVRFRQQLRESATTRLKERLSETDCRTVELGVQMQVAEGPADGCILSAIEDLDTDLVILATSGHGGIPGMLFGTTAERLLPDIRCSVLLIKPDDFVCPVDL